MLELSLARERRRDRSKGIDVEDKGFCQRANGEWNKSGRMRDGGRTTGWQSLECAEAMEVELNDAVRL